ncbi:MAG: VOC family protein [Deltaproteobacteria bacterium]|nr:VOC family protein [Deltaproteobacteria bacterium]MDQ3296458.1 VOC family protein [Myxococcota bacterium]
MAKPTPLGIKRLEGIHYYVRDLERSRQFYTRKLDFAETWRSSPELVKQGRQQSACFSAGNIQVVCSSPYGEGGRAHRFLSKHPDGVGTLVFEVEDAARTFALLDERGGTMIDEIQTFTDDGGTLKQFSITTPFGDCTFRFREHGGYRSLFPGAVPYHPYQGGGTNKFGFEEIDHVTSNFQTMKPMLLWLEQVLGFEQMWEVAFHTSDIDPKRKSGSGLKSIVMWDPTSGTKFANNEPARPFFKSSQINIFNEELRGDGVQHIALSVTDILSAVRGLRAANVTFMPTPGSYYDMLPERIEKTGIKTIDEDLNTLRELEVLIDGDHHHAYMLQIFLKEAAGLYGDPAAGPFFYEIIQRKGDRGFGAGNFRALFESIEREQQQKAGPAGPANTNERGGT